MVREIVTIAVGQGGIQLGNAVWSQYLAEHNISNMGEKMSETKNSKGEEDANFLTFFNEGQTGNCVPRNLYVDLEPTVVDEVKKGKQSKLFHQDYLLNAKEDAANNFARGHYTTGKEIMDQVNDRMIFNNQSQKVG